MKRKYFILVSVLILTVFLAGCGSSGIVTSVTDEAKIKNVISEYFLATNDQNWEKAKSYCVYGSEEYYDLCFFEDMINTYSQTTENITITIDADIINTDITGRYAITYLYFTILVTVDYNVVSYDNVYAYYYLQKIGNNWKIYLSVVI